MDHANGVNTAYHSAVRCRRIMISINTVISGVFIGLMCWMISNYPDDMYGIGIMSSWVVCTSLIAVVTNFIGIYTKLISKIFPDVEQLDKHVHNVVQFWICTLTIHTILNIIGSILIRYLTDSEIMSRLGVIFLIGCVNFIRMFDHIKVSDFTTGQVAKFTSDTYFNTQDSYSIEEGMQLPTECVICLGEFEDDEIVTKLQCRHLYHRECLAIWLRDHNSCPTCRDVVFPELDDDE